MVHLSVVVPCFNEAEVIDTFHTALVAALEPTRETFEICYVDDGSSDPNAAPAAATRRGRPAGTVHLLQP